MRNGREDRQRRKREAEERTEKYEKRTPQQQLNEIIRRGHSHCNEAFKLRKKLEENNLEKDN